MFYCSDYSAICFDRDKNKKWQKSAFSVRVYLSFDQEEGKNIIRLDILRFREKTMPQIKRKRQGVPN